MSEQIELNLDNNQEQTNETTSQVEEITQTPEDEIKQQPDNINTEQEINTEVDNEENNNEENKENENNEDYDLNELYKFLKDSAIVQSTDTEENLEFNSINELSEYLYETQQKQIENKVQEEINKYTGTYKDLFDFVKNGGKVEDFVQSYKDSYSTLDYAVVKNNSDLQYKILKDYYKQSTQWDNNMINKHLEKFSDDEIKEMSKSALTHLKDYEENSKKELLEKQKAEIEQQNKYYADLINNYENQLKEIDTFMGQQISQNEKNKIKNNLVNNVTYNKLVENFDKYRLTLVMLDNMGLIDEPQKIAEKFKNNSKTKYNFKKSKKTNNKNNEDMMIDLILPENTDNQKVKPSFIF